MAIAPCASTATMASVSLRSMDRAKDSTAAWAAVSISGLPTKPFCASRLNCPSAYFSSSEALNVRKSVAILVTAEAATKYDDIPTRTTAAIISGSTTRIILSRMLISCHYSLRSVCWQAQRGKRPILRVRAHMRAASARASGTSDEGKVRASRPRAGEGSGATTHSGTSGKGRVGNSRERAWRM